ncbi:MAG: cysteine desulfurase [Rhodothermaceae bacterium]|nr:MAG: cysteine desulfurase [Rhodothermaceae bacterium]
MRRIYLDHAATTPLDPAVFEAMLPYLREHFGNASSVHALGRKARFAVEESRERVAACLEAEPAEILFTSGGTESDNAALAGLLGGERTGLITSAAEHEAVLQPAERRAREGYPVTLLRPQASGAVAPEQVAAALTPETGLVSLMHANNEVGTLTDVRAVAALCRRHGVLFHTDAVQTAGLYALSVKDLGVDALSLSAHKFYGPKGVGVLYLRGGADFRPFLEGGAQERRRRAGTENVAAIVGLAAALERAVAAAPERLARLARLRRRLYRGLREALGDLFVCNTPMDEGAAAPHLLNIAFPPHDGRPFDGEMLILNLDMEGIAVSSGSACTSGALTPSHVLQALGHDAATAAAAIRFSLGKDTTEEEIDRTVDAVARVVRRMLAVM